MLKVVTKLLGGSTERALKDLRADVDEINGLEPEFELISDDRLRSRTDEFRKRLQDGEVLYDLLPEAFAATRESAKRTLGQRHFDVQLMGGMVLPVPPDRAGAGGSGLRDGQHHYRQNEYRRKS